MRFKPSVKRAIISLLCRPCTAVLIICLPMHCRVKVSKSASLTTKILRRFVIWLMIRLRWSLPKVSVIHWVTSLIFKRWVISHMNMVCQSWLIVRLPRLHYVVRLSLVRISWFIHWPNIWVVRVRRLVGRLSIVVNSHGATILSVSRYWTRQITVITVWTL